MEEEDPSPPHSSTLSLFNGARDCIPLSTPSGGETCFPERGGDLLVMVCARLSSCRGFRSVTGEIGFVIGQILDLVMVIISRLFADYIVLYYILKNNNPPVISLLKNFNQTSMHQ